jgi:peptide/nickel transport system permease protein
MTIPTSTLDATAVTPLPEAVGRSPGQLMWLRFKRDRAGIGAAVIVLFFFLVAILAPVISMVYGKDPYTLYGQENPGLLNDFGYPVGANGGVSSQFWFGIEPGLGRDVFTQLVYGIRTSLLIAVVATVLTSLLGVLFTIAFMPVVENLFVRPDEQTPVWLRAVTLVIVLSAFGWAGLARLLRGQVLTLREREFVEAARVTGASPARVVFRELLPNLWTPILIQSTLLLPALVTAEAALSFLGVGMIEPIPDWGRMFLRGTEVYQNDITYLVFPGVALLVFVIAFNLLGDSVRDAFDPKIKR